MRNLTMEVESTYTMAFVGGPLDGMRKTLPSVTGFYSVDVIEDASVAALYSRARKTVKGHYHMVEGTDRHTGKPVRFFAYVGVDK